MVGGIHHRAMGADAVQLADLFQAVEIESQQARVGLAAAGQVKAPAVAVGGDVIKATVAPDRDGSKNFIGPVGQGRMRQSQQHCGEENFAHKASRKRRKANTASHHRCGAMRLHLPNLAGGQSGAV